MGHWFFFLRHSIAWTVRRHCCYEVRRKTDGYSFFFLSIFIEKDAKPDFFELFFILLVLLEMLQYILNLKAEQIEFQKTLPQRNIRNQASL